MLTVDPATGLAGVLAQRDDPMSACRELAWLKRFKRVPRDASPPLAMSGPHPRAVGSYGAKCIEWGRREFGIEPRWWQALAITRQLEHDAGGNLVWREIVESGSRRIGKSVRLRLTALWRIAHAEMFNEPQLAMLVSKDLAVGKEIHRPAWAWAERRGWGVTRLNGAQEVETSGGDRWLLRAPNAAYGYDVGYGQCDEAWSIDPEAIADGIEPALLERYSPQLHLTSTGHVRASSLMRRRLIASLRDADPDVLLLFWGAHPDADWSDERTWRASSAYWSEARRAFIKRKYLAALAGEEDPEIDDPDPVRGWASQYLNVWPLLLDSSSLLFPSWPNLVAERDLVPTSLAIAGDVSRRWLALGGSDGSTVGVVTPEEFDAPKVSRTRETEFVAAVARIATTRRLTVALQENGPVWTLRDALRESGVHVQPVSFNDFVQAGADFDTAAAENRLRHCDDADLNDDVSRAAWRVVNDRTVLSRKSGDICALEAVVLAQHIARRRNNRRFIVPSELEEASHGSVQPVAH